jgi:protein-S-isoprenylcysteine O-methyltransferase Ste14
MIFYATAWTCWGIFVLAWVIGAIYNLWRAPRQVRGQSLRSFAPSWLLVALGVGIAVRLAPRGFLAAVTFWSLPVAVAGAVLLIVSTLFALWARVTLGLMWSSMPAVREHHELRMDGPYQITRHPIYTSILGMLLGTAMLAGWGPALPGLIAIAAIFIYRIPREEKLMTETFGERYTAYKHQVPRLVPFVRL